jgi:hypothetical protein
MQDYIAIGCLIGFLSICILAVLHVLCEMWRHGTSRTPIRLNSAGFLATSARVRRIQKRHARRRQCVLVRLRPPFPSDPSTI